MLLLLSLHVLNKVFFIYIAGCFCNISGHHLGEQPVFLPLAWWLKASLTSLTPLCCGSRKAGGGGGGAGEGDGRQEWQEEEN